MDYLMFGRKQKKARVEETATRATLSDAWQEKLQQVDWMAAPGMADYVNGLVSGKPLVHGGHWAIYALNHHLLPLANRDQSGQHGGRLSMLSLACGSAHIEQALISNFHWPIESLLGLEYDEALRAAATESFAAIDNCRSEFKFFDFNAKNVAEEKYDLVYCCHSIHHAENLEQLLPFINDSMKDDGLFVGIDYFGPTRFQIEHDVLPIIEELFSVLPEELRVDLRSNEPRVEHQFETGTIKEVRELDPSESVRSSDLRTLLFSNFEVVEIKPMGGTLLRWLLQYRAGNFDVGNANHTCIARLLQIIERELIASRRIRSDDLFFVLKKSKRL